MKADDGRCQLCGASNPEGAAFCSHCGASTASAFADEETDPLQGLKQLFGREITFERLLGSGAVGTVYLGLHHAWQRRVAVKTLLPQSNEDPARVERFIREAHMAASLIHPHVVSIYSVRTTDTMSAIVMEYVEGRSLGSIIAERAMLPLPVIGQLVQQVAGALQYAHDHGIIHRDVKPANILVEHTGRAVVSDFGLARQRDAVSLTGPGTTPGTVAYMSPEQLTGAVAGQASDQYALGVVAFEMLARRRPFIGILQEVARAHVNTPPPLSKLRAETPEAIAAAVDRMLRKSPDERFPDLNEVAQLFGSLVEDADTTTSALARRSRPVGHVVRPLD